MARKLSEISEAERKQVLNEIWQTMVKTEAAEQRIIAADETAEWNIILNYKCGKGKVAAVEAE